jgi:hypothetical protein
VEKFENIGWVEQPRDAAIFLAFNDTSPPFLISSIAVSTILSFVIFTLGGIKSPYISIVI